MGKSYDIVFFEANSVIQQKLLSCPCLLVLLLLILRLGWWPLAPMNNLFVAFFRKFQVGRLFSLLRFCFRMLVEWACGLGRIKNQILWPARSQHWRLWRLRVFTRLWLWRKGVVNLRFVSNLSELTIIIFPLIGNFEFRVWAAYFRTFWICSWSGTSFWTRKNFMLLAPVGSAVFIFKSRYTYDCGIFVP